MNRATKLVLLLLPAIIILAGCQAGTAQPPPAGPAPTAVVPPAGQTAWNGDYSTHIQPVFDAGCTGCHGPQRAENGLRLDGYEQVMRGTQHGPVVVPGEPAASALVSVIRGTTDPSIRMPHGGQRVDEQAIENIVLWIEAGAPPPR